MSTAVVPARIITSTTTLEGPATAKKVMIQLKMTARCLFGAPDTIQCDQLVSKVQDTKQWAFQRKWNFSIPTESQLTSRAPHPENNFQWEGPLQNKSINRQIGAKFQLPVHYPPNKRSVMEHPTGGPLLSASISDEELLTQPENQDVLPVNPSLTSNPAHENNMPSPMLVDVTDSKSFTSPSTSSSSGENPGSLSPQRSLTSSPTVNKSGRNSSPGSHSKSNKGSNYEKDVCSRSPHGDILLFPAVKQKYITDYMRIKKMPSRLKKIRCRE